MTHEDTDLRPINDSRDIDIARRSLQKVVAYADNTSLKIVKRDRWVAIPVESGYHFSDTDQRKLLHAIVQNGDRNIIALPLEDLGDFPQVFEVTPTAKGMEAFNRAFGHFNFTLANKSVSWVVICTTSEYFVVMGMPDFVMTVLGSELEDAFSRFSEFASDTNWPATIRNTLLVILHTLQKDYLIAHPGELISIPLTLP
jgi:hypothetical protein